MIAALFKAARGSRATDPGKMLKELLAMVGMKADGGPVDRADVQERFRALSRASLPPGAEVFELTGTMQDGTAMSALIVIGSSQDMKQAAIKHLDSDVIAVQS